MLSLSLRNLLLLEYKLCSKTFALIFFIAVSVATESAPLCGTRSSHKNDIVYIFS